MRILNIFRGLPGSGKSTAAFKSGGIVLETDQWLIQGDGEYVFTPDYHSCAIMHTQIMTEQAMKNGYKFISVTGCFVRKYSMEAYFSLAKKYGVKIWKLEKNYGSTHSVPQDTIDNMSSRWEDIDEEVVLD